MAVTRADIVEGLRNLGINAGDILHIHSSLKSMGSVEGGADTVIAAFMDVVGPKGLVSFPTHTWGTVNARQPVFHEELSPSTVGLVSETFRKRPDAVRSLHPTHSVAAAGYHTLEFTAGHELDDTPCGPHSPYRRLVEWKGKVVMLGINLECMTLLHAFEEMAEAPWTFSPGRQLLYTVRRDGTIIKVPSRRHSWMPEVERDFPGLEPGLLRVNAMRIGQIGAASVRVVDAWKSSEHLVPALKKDPGYFLKKPV